MEFIYTFGSWMIIAFAIWIFILIKEGANDLEDATGQFMIGLIWPAFIIYGILRGIAWLVLKISGGLDESDF